MAHFVYVKRIYKDEQQGEWLNMDRVIWMRFLLDELQTQIMLDDGKIVFVDESPEEIQQRIMQEKQKYTK